MIRRAAILAAAGACAVAVLYLVVRVVGELARAAPDMVAMAHDPYANQLLRWNFLISLAAGLLVASGALAALGLDRANYFPVIWVIGVVFLQNFGGGLIIIVGEFLADVVVLVLGLPRDTSIGWFCGAVMALTAPGFATAALADGDWRR